MARDGAADPPATGPADDEPRLDWPTDNDELKFANVLRFARAEHSQELVISFGNFVPRFDEGPQVVRTIVHVVVAPNLMRDVIKMGAIDLDTEDAANTEGVEHGD